MIENIVYYSSIILCISLGGFYKKIDDTDMKRNYGIGLEIFSEWMEMLGGEDQGDLDQIGDVVKKGQVKSTLNRRACMKRLMNVDEAKEVCLEEVVYDYPDWKETLDIYLHQMSLAYTWIYLQYLHFHVGHSAYIIWVHQTIALRVVGLAFEVHLAAKPKVERPSSTEEGKPEVPPVTVNANRSMTNMTKDPAAVDIIAYSFYFIGLHRGPYYRWRIFEEHFSTPFGVLGDCRIITEYKLKKALVCGIGYLILSMKYTTEVYNDDSFYRSLDSDSRYLYSIPQLIMFFLHHQMLMMLCTAVCVETGFGVYPSKCISMPGHGPTSRTSLLNIAARETNIALQQEYNFSMLKCFDNEKLLFGPKMRDTLHGWDMSVGYWFSSYIYRQLIKGSTEKRSACSFAAWCLWSGPSLPYVILSATLWVYVQIEAEYSELYQPNESLQFPLTLGFSLMRLFCLLYLTPCLVFTDTLMVFRYYNSIYWAFHILLIILLFVIAVINKMRR